MSPPTSLTNFSVEELYKTVQQTINAVKSSHSYIYHLYTIMPLIQLLYVLFHISLKIYLS